MPFFNTAIKLFKRKKTNGYYEASDMLTPHEKQSLLLGISIILIPLIITLILIALN